MPPRRGATTNSLSPPEVIFPGTGNATGSLSSSPRSTSPSGGFTSFLTRPTKWFNRSSSANAGRSSISSSEPRSSTSSSRKHKISHPTDPRPFLEHMGITQDKKMAAASRSVLDLSLTHNPAVNDDSPRGVSARAPSSPSQPSVSRGLGDLRNISRKPWSKSADDLGKLTHISSPVTAPTPIDTTFHEKIDHYRNNHGGSIGSTSNAPSPSASSFTSMQKNYPFPVISGSQSEPLSSSPPQRPSIQLSCPPSENTTGVSLAPITSTSSGHVRTRSHSFTPRLPSKLVTPKVSLMPPPSPKRKGSGSSDRLPEKEDKSPAGSVGHGPSSRSPFPFALGTNSKSVSPISAPVAADSLPSPIMLAPPRITEPPADTQGPSKQEKRTSQMVHHCGFVNRLTDFSPSTMNLRAHYSYMSGGSASGLAKGWKPFKLVLKGTKLYFYKPPSDRSAAIKELFPTELVTVLEDEGLAEGELEVPDAEEEDQYRGGRGRGRADALKRRAYWGRGTHPALVVVGETIEHGTPEALVHEAVFATTFLDPDSASTPVQDNDARAKQDGDEDQASSEADTSSPEQQETASSPSPYKAGWQGFSSTVLFTLPALVGRAKIEAEFIRCCSFLLSGAEEHMKEIETSRVRWLASQYLGYYGGPAKAEAWEEWRKETIPDFPADYGAASKVGGIPQTSSTQALYTASPSLGSTGAELSPNFGAFSPRPANDHKMISIVEALGELPSTNSGGSQSNVRKLRATLEREGLTRDALLSIDAQILARSLSVFHLQLLKQVPDNLTAEHCIDSDAAGSDASEPPSRSVRNLAPFAGDDKCPHWLTRLILVQVLVPEPAGHNSFSGVEAPLQGSEDRHVPASRAHTRAEVITAWIKVGELSRKTGDECSWRAIFAAVCSHPVARLDKVWKRVDPEAVETVQSWVQLHSNSAFLPSGCPLVIPWASNARNQIRVALDAARSGDGDEWRYKFLLEAREKFEALRTSFALCSRRSHQEHAEEAEDVRILTNVWRDLFEGGGSNAMASKFVRIDQFMSLSLAAEPRRKGLFEPHYWTRPTHQQTVQSLAAILFPEPLPTVAFINRDLLLRGRLESNASLNLHELQQVRESWLKAGADGHKSMQGTKNNGLDLGGTVLPLYDGELLLLVQSPSEAAPSLSRPTSRTPSRPSSSVNDSPVPEKAFTRSPSIRVSPGATHGLERKASVARRNSLPSISQRTSLVVPEVNAEKAIRVVVQAGTIDRLVDVLVHGLHGVSVSVSDDNGEMPLTDTKTREVKVDMEDFSEVWWNTYRSFLTPQILFEFLRKRYIGARLPTSPSTMDVNDVIRKRSEVLDAMSEWITRGGGAQDALDDVQLHSSFETFLSQLADHDLLSHIPAEDTQSRQAVSALDQIRHNLYMSFLSQTLRPSRSNTANDSFGAVVESQSRAFGSEAPNVDQLDAEELVGNLDSMASAAFRNVTQEDLFVTADLLEVQSADRTGWFLPREPNSISDEVEIQFMSSYIAEVEVSTMISELSQDSFYRLLPMSVRSCIRAFGVLRKWLISKLVAPRIGIKTRQTRMELYLRAIEVCRIRGSDAASLGVPLVERHVLRSFVEAVITSAVLSVESRIHYRAWQNVAIARGTTCDTLSALLSKPAIISVHSRGNLTVDIGWILERILEIIGTPDVLETANTETTGLVNFDKRRPVMLSHDVVQVLNQAHRSLHTLINGTSGVSTTRRPRRRQLDRRDFERLAAIEREATSIQFDLRGIREEAHREAVSSGPLGTKKIHRPFQTLVCIQQEKNKRDRHLRDRLSREKRQEQQRQDRREEYLNKAMYPRRQPTISKQMRNKKSMSSAFSKFMRPISSAFSLESVSSSSGVKRTPAELDFTPSGKPSFTLSIVDAQVAQFVNNERSFTFQIDAEDGGHYLLQTMSKAEMKKWMDTIQHVSKMAAQRRLTYLGQNSKMQLSDHLLGQPATSSRDPRAVFGIDLDTLLQREAENGEVPPGTIPSVLERLVHEVESRGLTEIGIYRIAGAHSEVNAFKDAINEGEWPVTSTTDIHAVCDLIKSWFRVLPGGLFPSTAYNAILDAVASNETALGEKLSDIRKVVHGLPETRFDLLKRIVEHLEKVTDYEENNQMTAETLATVFSPNLLCPPNNDLSLFFANISPSHRVTKLLIAHFHTIFDSEADQDVEAELEQEQDGYEEPIPEEDEDEDMLCDDVPETPADDKTDLLGIPSEPPILDLNLGSPHSLSFTVA